MRSLTQGARVRPSHAMHRGARAASSACCSRVLPCFQGTAVRPSAPPEPRSLPCARAADLLSNLSSSNPPLPPLSICPPVVPPSRCTEDRSAPCVPAHGPSAPLVIVCVLFVEAGREPTCPLHAHYAPPLAVLRAPWGRPPKLRTPLVAPASRQALEGTSWPLRKLATPDQTAPPLLGTAPAVPPLNTRASFCTLALREAVSAARPARWTVACGET